jgi:signal transduction histidine kinase
VEVIHHARTAVRHALEEARALVVARRQRVVPWSAAVVEIETLVREAAAAFDCRVQVSETGDGSVPSLSTAEHHALSRLATEAVTNALRHGAAPVIDVEVAVQAGQVRLGVANARGSSTPGGPAGTGFGLRAARRRLGRLGGTLELELLPDGGFRLEARFPAAFAELAPAA